MKIGYQGEKGAYSEQAVTLQFPEDESEGYSSFAEVFSAVADGSVDRGVVPIENFIAGSINQTYDLLLEHDLFVVGEIYLPIEHCLIGKSGMGVDKVKKVYSHPQALAQCEEFMLSKGLEPRAAGDTAGSVKIVKERGREDEAAIASERAAQIYGLEVLERDIATVKNNITRFIVIAREKCEDLGSDVKSSLVFAARHIPAALYKCLGGFATNNVNLEKLESRPIRGEHGNYLFYLDFAGKQDDEDVREALSELEFFTESVKFLGSYPKGK